VRWLNTSATADTFVIHLDGILSGCPHQNPGSPTSPGDAYQCTLGGAPSSFDWYCHAPGPTVTGLVIEAVD
jgi:hypothetical protein